jgi:hypothetical protein
MTNRKVFIVSSVIRVGPALAGGVIGHHVAKFSTGGFAVIDMNGRKAKPDFSRPFR